LRWSRTTTTPAGIDLDVVPIFGIGTASHYEVADEGFGRQPPRVAGHPDLAIHSGRVSSTKASI
jgi:hypothetical protein